MLWLHQVKKLLADQPDLLQRYSDSVLDSYVDDNKRVKWCALVLLQFECLPSSIVVASVRHMHLPDFVLFIICPNRLLRGCQGVICLF